MKNPLNSSVLNVGRVTVHNFSEQNFRKKTAY